MKATTGTIARTIIFFITLINGIFAIIGWNPINIDSSAVYDAVSVIALFVGSIVAWWKNNSFTKPAIQADNMKEYLKIGLSLHDCINMAIEESKKEE